MRQEFYRIQTKDSKSKWDPGSKHFKNSFSRNVLSICQKYRSGFGDTVVNKEMKTPALLELKFYWRVHGRQGFPGDSAVKNPPANPRATGDTGSIPGSGRSPAGGNGNPFQHSCLGNPRDRGAWWATVQGSQRVRHNWEIEHACTIYDGKYDQWRMALASLPRALLLFYMGFPLLVSSL